MLPPQPQVLDHILGMICRWGLGLGEEGVAYFCELSL